jgi:hypothetical protein
MCHRVALGPGVGGNVAAGPPGNPIPPGAGGWAGLQPGGAGGWGGLQPGGAGGFAGAPGGLGPDGIGDLLPQGGIGDGIPNPLGDQLPVGGAGGGLQDQFEWPQMSREDALEMGLTERDPQWPWRDLHEIEGHHPLMEGERFREFWRDRGFTNQEIEGFVVDLDKDIHRAISEAPAGEQPWWDQQLMGRIFAEEARQGGVPLTKAQLLQIANDLLREVQKWSP